MSPFHRLRVRLAERPDTEHEQALLRIVIVGMFLGYMAFADGWPGGWSAHDTRMVAILAIFLAIATAIFVAICVRPAPNVPRRLIGMLADSAGCTWYMWVAGDYGFFVIGVYLFITFGNGFRYGSRYLFGCQALCMTGLIGVLMFAPYWQQHRIAGLGLLIALLVLPLYVSTLLKRIQEARARAEEANVAKTTFLANMSHEMRTPLNGIVGVVDLLKTTSLSTHQNELVGLLRHSITVLRSLVDDVLDISKIEAGHLTIEVAPFDLHACVNGLVTLLRPHAEAKGLLLQAAVDPALEYRLRGDSHHLRQILLNLLGNAIKFTERGEVTLAVNLKQETAEGMTARFEVRDTGIGISPEAQRRIFERFVQADQSTTRKYGGTGLGTTIAKQLAELMGGSIGVESTLGQGSTFWVELPFLHDPTPQAATSPEANAGDRKTEPRSLVLVLGDGRNSQLTSTLHSMGERYEVVAPSGSIGPRIDELKASGAIVRAVIATCSIEQACTAFSAAAQRGADRHMALIYVADSELSLVDKARVNSIKGAYALAYPSAKQIANAIHAANAGMESESPGSTDLAMVLRRDRVSLKILVAEDNPTNQRIIRQLLENAGHQVILASDGEEALDRYEDEQPDMAILDFNMPQRSGVEVIQAIRLMEATGTRMPAIILSASVTKESKESAATAGADGYIGKPFDATALIEEIDRLAKRTAKVRSGIASALPKLHTPAPARRRDAASSSAADVSAAATPIRARSSQTATVGRMPPNAELIDRKRLDQLEDIARDPGFLTELIRGFAGDVDSILARTGAALDSGSLELIPDLMHTLKGAAVGVGANQLATLAVECDACARGSTRPDVQAKFSDIQASFEATSAFLKEYLQEHHDASI
jgi:two-component system, sensor histidine kinase RpfC